MILPAPPPLPKLETTASPPSAAGAVVVILTLFTIDFFCLFADYCNTTAPSSSNNPPTAAPLSVQTPAIQTMVRDYRQKNRMANLQYYHRLSPKDRYRVNAEISDMMDLTKVNHVHHFVGSGVKLTSEQLKKLQKVCGDLKVAKDDFIKAGNAMDVLISEEEKRCTLAAAMQALAMQQQRQQERQENQEKQQEPDDGNNTNHIGSGSSNGSGNVTDWDLAKITQAYENVAKTYETLTQMASRGMLYNYAAHPSFPIAYHSPTTDPVRALMLEWHESLCNAAEVIFLAVIVFPSSHSVCACVAGWCRGADGQ